MAQRQATTREIMLKRHQEELASVKAQFAQHNATTTTGNTASSTEIQNSQQMQLKVITDRHAVEMAQLNKSFQVDLEKLFDGFRNMNAAAEYAGVNVGTNRGATAATTTGNMNVNGGSLATTTTSAISSNAPSTMHMTSTVTNKMHHHQHHPPPPPLSTTTLATTTKSTTTTTTANNTNTILDEATANTSSTSSLFLEKLSGTLSRFWTDQLHQMRDLGTTKPQTEHDFKNHNDLPLARIKRIMKSDEDVRMISAEAPVLFAKACEMFILELTLRSWSYSENNKRRTLQKEDIREAIQRTDIFDFLVDVIH